MRKLIMKLAKSRAGATAIEYGLIAALISVVVVAALTAIGTNLNTTYNTISTDLKAANAG